MARGLTTMRSWRVPGVFLDTDGAYVCGRCSERWPRPLERPQMQDVDAQCQSCGRLCHDDGGVWTQGNNEVMARAVEEGWKKRRRR